MTDAIAKFNEANKALSRTLAIDGYASAVAVGMAADDPAMRATGIIVLWYDGQLYSLHISDLYARDSVSKAEVAVTIMSVMYAAQDNWRAAHTAARAEAEAMLRGGMTVEQLKSIAAHRAREILTGKIAD